jgi:L-aspartate oxidase
VAGTFAGPAPTPVAIRLPPPSDPAAVRPILSRGAGLERDREGLQQAVRALLPLATGQHAKGPGAESDPAIVALMIAVSALRREESRGAHWRTDFPERTSEPRRTTLRLAEAIATAQENFQENSQENSRENFRENFRESFQENAQENSEAIDAHTRPLARKA